MPVSILQTGNIKIFCIAYIILGFFFNTIDFIPSESCPVTSIRVINQCSAFLTSFLVES